MIKKYLISLLVEIYQDMMKILIMKHNDLLQNFL